MYFIEDEKKKIVQKIRLDGTKTKRQQQEEDRNVNNERARKETQFWEKNAEVKDLMVQRNEFENKRM